MVVSNEPGFYEDGAFGIRIENVVECVEADTPEAFGHDGSPYLGFNPLTKVPMCSLLLEPMLLEQVELDWVDAYHARKPSAARTPPKCGADGTVDVERARTQLQCAIAMVLLTRALSSRWRLFWRLFLVLLQVPCFLDFGDGWSSTGEV